MATLIAANSLSTLMNSHGASAPLLTRSPSPSTICVCGEIGYAQITSGRHSATASATAREPSVCLSMGRLLHPALDARKCLAGGREVGGGHLALELDADRVRHCIERDQARQRREAAQQHRIGQRSAQVLERDLGCRQGDQPLPTIALLDFTKAQFIEAATAVDQHITVRLQTDRKSTRLNSSH